jgi:integrase
MPKLTKRFIDALKSTAPKGQWFADDECEGFYMVVFPSGKKSFWARYRVAGRRGKVKIGKYGQLTVEDARKRAKAVISEALAGRDPAETKKKAKAMPTWKEWAEERVKDAGPPDSTKPNAPPPEPRLKDWRKYRFHLRWAGEQGWDSLPLNSITRDDVQVLFNRYTKRSVVGANRWLAGVRKAFSDAVKLGYIGTNPASHFKLNRESAGRERVLTPEEMQRLRAAVAKMADPVPRVAFELLILTGARLSEVLRARWDDFHLDDDPPTWTIPKAKSGRRESIVLPAEAVAALRAAPRTASPLVVPRAGAPLRPRADLRREWDALKAAAKLVEVRIHDLRRSFGKRVTQTSGLHMASRVLRHSSIKITEGHYSPIDSHAQAEAMAKATAALYPFPKRKGGR